MIDGWLVLVVAVTVFVVGWVLHRLGDRSDPPDE